MPAIALEGISKKYRIYRRQRDRLRETLSLGRIQRGHDFWALKDVDLKIEPGTSLGLLGRNGAGKSTLLQIISGVLQPTTGAILTNGRISALLQLGAGFNGEFTGRENAIMNGLLLGIDRQEMLDRFDEIEAFADLGQFMDQPVKTYSSGMRARLGFAVAVNVEPDILLVDETLSVGDGVFRHMGIQKMRELRDSGATIIFVSHSTAMVKEFCTEAALLHEGRLIAHGDASETADQYQALLLNVAAREERTEGTIRPPEPEADGEYESPDFKENLDLKRRASRYGTGEARIQDVEVLDEHGRPATSVAQRATMTIRMHAQYAEDVSGSVLGIVLRNKAGLDVIGANTKRENTPIGHRSSGDRIVVDFSFKTSLRPGSYSVAALVSHDREDQTHLNWIDWIEVAATFKIDKPPGQIAPGPLVYLPTEVTVFEPERALDPEQSA